MRDVVTDWITLITDGVVNSLRSIVDFSPKLIGAALIFFLGWIIAKLVKRLVIKILDITQLEPFAEKVGISSALKRVGASITPIELLSEIIRWAVVLIFLNPTVEILGLTQITVIINDVLLYIPRVIVAALILMLGMIFADLTAQFVKSTAAAFGSTTANALEVVTKYAVIIFVVLASLSELGIAQSLIATLFTGFVAMFTIAGGLAFGLGGKDLAAEILENLKKSLQEKRTE